MKKIYNNSDSIFPNENFIFLQKSIADAKGNKIDGLSSASGIVIGRKNNTLYGLTAAHWCKDFETQELTGILQHMGTLGHEKPEDFKNAIYANVDYFGENYFLNILDMNEIDDVCLVSFESRYASQAETIKIADNYPQLGEEIYTISAPMGVKSPTIRNHFKGKFSGCIENEVECLYTLPGTHGSSGSGILNEDGELVGVLTISVYGFHNITGGVKIEAINDILERNNIRK